MTIVRRIASLLGAATLISVLAVPAFGYTGEVAANITVTGPAGAVRCSTPIKLSATVKGPSGTGVPGIAVSWRVTKAPAGATDKLRRTTTKTGATGIATNLLSLSCVAGKRTLTASARGGVLGAISITLVPRGLPNTATLPETRPAPSTPGAALVLVLVSAVLAVLVGARRFRA